MAEVRRRLLEQGIDTPQASNVAVTCFAHVPRAKNLDAVQIVLSDPHYWGGIRRQKNLSFLCETLGLGLSMHSNNHLGVSLMTMSHAAAASPHLTHACDTHYPWQEPDEEVIKGGKVPIVDGCVQLTRAPGLGLELDHDQLGKLHDQYLSCGIRQRDDVKQMQRYQPDWKAVKPRY